MMAWLSDGLLLTTARVSAVCSILGSGGCIFLFLYLKWWKVSTHHTILFHMSCTDILNSSAVLVGSDSFGKPTLCNFQGWILQSCGQVSQMWCTIIGINLLLQMVLYWKDKKCRRMMRWYSLVVYGTGITTASIVTFRGQIKPAGTWCWVGADWPWDRMAFFYIPLWLLLALNIVIVAWIVRALWKAIEKIPKNYVNRETQAKHYRWVTLHTSMFVMVGMVIWLPGTVYRIWQIVDDNPPYWVIFLQKVLDPGQGLLNFLVYVAPMQLKSIYVSRRRKNMSRTTVVMGKTETKERKIVLESPTISFDIESDFVCEGADMFAPARSMAMPQSGHGLSAPNLFRSNLPLTNIESKPRLIEAVSKSETDLLGWLGSRRATINRGQIGRLNEPMDFHNYSMVMVDEVMRPVWKIEKTRSERECFAGGPVTEETKQVQVLTQDGAGCKQESPSVPYSKTRFSV